VQIDADNFGCRNYLHGLQTFGASVMGTCREWPEKCRREEDEQPAAGF